MSMNTVVKSNTSDSPIAWPAHSTGYVSTVSYTPSYTPSTSYAPTSWQIPDISHIEARLEKLLQLLQAFEQSITDKLQAIEERLDDLEWELEKQAQ